MKKKLFLYLYFLLVLGIMITALIVYKDIDGSIAIAFVIGTIMVLFLCTFYFIFSLVVEMSRLKWSELRKILYKFIVYFVFLCVITYIVDKIFKSLEFDVYTIVSNSLGFSFAFVASDIVFNKKKNW